MATKKPDLDESTLRIAERMLATPPKPHSEMKLGKRKAKTGAKAALKKPGRLKDGRAKC